MGPYDEEYVDTVEVGLKSDLMDGHLRFNVAGFYNWYDDIQLASIYFTQDQNGNTVNGNSIINAAKARPGESRSMPSGCPSRISP